MRMPTFFLLTALCCGAATAQSVLPMPAPATPPAAAAATPLVPGSPSKAPAVEQKVERIVLEDNGSIVEEVRYGGVAQSIAVTPKAAVPAYEIVPADSARSRGLARDALQAAPGQRVWNAFRF